MSYAPPPQLSGYPQAGSPQGAYGYGYAPPPPRRGMIRIVLGILGLLGSILVLLVLPWITGLIGLVVDAATAEDSIVATGTETVSFEADSLGIYTLYVPADEAATAACAVTEGTWTVSAPTASTTITVEGRSMAPVVDIDGTTSESVTVSCAGASATAVSEFSGTGGLIGAGLGLVLPILGGLFFLLLLISGIIGRVRSGRGR